MCSPAADDADGMVNISIRQDRDLKKKIFVPGDYQVFPSEGSRVRVKITELSLTDGIGEECDVDPLSRYFRSDFNGRLEIGTADYYLDEDFERCLQVMSRKEESLLTMQYRDATGEMRRRVSCRAEVLDASDEEPISEWEWKRLYAAAVRNKERGVELVKERRVADAFRRFSKGFKKLEKFEVEATRAMTRQKNTKIKNSPRAVSHFSIDMFILNGKLVMAIEPYDQEKIPTVRFGDLVILKVKLLSNLGHCQLHFRAYDATITICDRVLDIDDFNVKALYRRGVARMGLQDWEAAHNDMKLVLRLDPSNKEAMQKLNIIDPKLKQINDKYNKIIKKMFA